MRPFESLRVLDVTRVLAGPFALLAQLRARADAFQRAGFRDVRRDTFRAIRFHAVCGFYRVTARLHPLHTFA